MIEQKASSEGYIPTPDSIEEEGLLVGWSLEHEKIRKTAIPVGFLGKKEPSNRPQYLQPILHKGPGHLMTIASTLPIRNIVVTLKFTGNAKPRFYHQLEITSMLRHWLPDNGAFMDERIPCSL